MDNGMIDELEKMMNNAIKHDQELFRKIQEDRNALRAAMHENAHALDKRRAEVDVFKEHLKWILDFLADGEPIAAYDRTREALGLNYSSRAMTIYNNEAELDTAFNEGAEAQRERDARRIPSKELARTIRENPLVARPKDDEVVSKDIPS